MDEKEIIRLYTEEEYTLRRIAEVFGSNHHKIKKILVSNGVTVSNTGRKRKPFTEEHKRKIGDGARGNRRRRGKKMPLESLYKNMRAHLKYEVSLDFLQQYEIEKLKCLNKLIVRGDRISKEFDAEIYMNYIKKFYHDTKFNRVYDIWSNSDKNKWALPSLDHIIPLSRGGDNSLNNLQVLTWFENKSKFTMTQEEWEEFRIKTNTHSEYFV